ncbi:YggS family pyridoxal phosphate-dependent enzyme [Ketobacter alkanivorans]|uniref:Pyridoxal phosphate homeostasis protein n=1 Tax=Ketobacter alkanivorans TaxID=1917421 RepID=A0A2K9LLN7_9GAMM|nr:YggS family pyridoxal phosphate-dependent enzyme [Ketobacter alkanivorans]AUM13266.1 YggS family pyridoxal phosphate-dependent enzyme [Ketobacter alkanivorans]
MTNDLQQRFQQVIQHIRDAAARLGKPEPTLLAVSKKHPSDAIRTLYDLGQRDFGESYWQEAESKLADLNDLDIVWHFIGPIQSNKTRPIAEHFDWVHSIDREKVARRLSEQRPAHLPPLKVCLQVNIDHEDTKSGVPPEQVLPLARAVSGLPNLHLAGLMCIPSRVQAAGEDETPQRAAFHRLALLKQQLEEAGITTQALSMGMSDDLEAAIAEGSTLVRVGTALFGERR